MTSRAAPSTPVTSQRSIYKWLFAWLSARKCDRYEPLWADHKRALLEPLRGDIVEIGPGVGINLRYYAAAVRWTGIEPNHYMHQHIRRQAANTGRAITLHCAPAEQMPLADASADAVVATHVFCSVHDAPAVLREVLRVLRPGGRVAFFEHVAAPQGSRRRTWQRIVAPVWRCIADGCRCCQDTERILRAAGFADVQLERFNLDLPIIAPHIRGFAFKA
jgi:ubiquinone/menaquinone biosynthesis C-methylase UbiE